MIGSRLFRIFILLPTFYWLYLIFLSDLGAEPAKVLNHKTGEISLYFLLLNLLVGFFISQKFKFPQGLRFLLLHRRFLGVVTFIYLILHMLLYLALEGFEKQAFNQMYTKTYLIFASLAWIMIFFLAVTSNNFVFRKLGAKKWKLIHRSVYFASALVTIHVLLIEKTDLVKYGIIFSILWISQIFRFVRSRKRTT